MVCAQQGVLVETRYPKASVVMISFFFFEERRLHFLKLPFTVISISRLTSVGMRGGVQNSDVGPFPPFFFLVAFPDVTISSFDTHTYDIYIYISNT